MSSTVSLAFSTLFAVGALVVIALAFATDSWIDNYVRPDPATGKSPTPNPNPPSNEDLYRIYVSRRRGLFRECFYNNATYLARCVVAFFIVSMILLLVGGIFGAVSCWTSGFKAARLAGVFVLVASIFAALAMAFFHGVDYTEKEKLSTTSPRDPAFYYKLWPQNIKSLTQRRYSWSYVLGWVGTGLGLIASGLYMFTSWYIKDRKRENKLFETYTIRTQQRHKYPQHSGAINGGPYEVYDGPMTLRSQPVYTSGANSNPAYSTFRGPATHYQGAVQEQPYVYYLNGKPVYTATRSPAPAYFYEDDVPHASIKPSAETWEYRY